jgi:hypothetical protein
LGRARLAERLTDRPQGRFHLIIGRGILQQAIGFPAESIGCGVLLNQLGDDVTARDKVDQPNAVYRDEQPG